MKPRTPNVVGANFVLDLFGDNFDDQETYSGPWQEWYRHESYLSYYFAATLLDTIDEFGCGQPL